MASGYRVLTFSFGAGGVQPWVADDDYFLTGAVNSTTTQASMFSTEPINTIATILATTKLWNTVIVLLNDSRTPIQLNFPINKGETYYARADGITCLQLYLEPMIQLA